MESCLPAVLPSPASAAADASRRQPDKARKAFHERRRRFWKGGIVRARVPGGPPECGGCGGCDLRGRVRGRLHVTLPRPARRLHLQRRAHFVVGGPATAVPRGLDRLTGAGLLPSVSAPARAGQARRFRRIAGLRVADDAGVRGHVWTAAGHSGVRWPGLLALRPPLPAARRSGRMVTPCDSRR